MLSGSTRIPNLLFSCRRRRSASLNKRVQAYPGAKHPPAATWASLVSPCQSSDIRPASALDLEGRAERPLNRHVAMLGDPRWAHHVNVAAGVVTEHDPHFRLIDHLFIRRSFQNNVKRCHSWLRRRCGRLRPRVDVRVNRQGNDDCGATRHKEDGFGRNVSQNDAQGPEDRALPGYQESEG
jgi:hypothetical protein